MSGRAHKKAFSGKKKWEQMKARRAEHRAEEDAEKERERDVYLFPSGKASGPEKMKKKRHPKAEDPEEQRNKLVTVFAKESREELDNRKKASRLPLQRLLTNARRLTEAQCQSSPIDIPKRPKWDYGADKHELERAEQHYFQDWLRGVYGEYTRERLNYFEHNLEVWRQLWRTIELSDILFIVVDARYPMFHFPPALYNHVTQDHGKPVVVVMNKIDLISEQTLREWVYYFRVRFPLVHVVPFSSLPKGPPNPGDILEEGGDVIFRKRKKRRMKKIPAFGAESLLAACANVKLRRVVDGVEWDVAQQIAHARDVAAAAGITASTAVSEDTRPADSYVTIGMVGHPNVGKSALVNAMMGKHLVSVKRTPGHTKHFQTLFLMPHIRLCDCPGLVFPASDMSKPLQVVCGIVPVAKLPEPFTSVGLLASYLPLEVFYGLRHPLEIETEEAGETYEGAVPPWSAWDICESYAVKRGFRLAQSGRPDHYRAAQMILYDCLDGNVMLAFKPPLPAEPVDWSTVNVVSPLVSAREVIGDSSSSDAEDEPESTGDSLSRDAEGEPDDDEGAGDDTDGDSGDADDEPATAPAAVKTNAFAALAELSD